MLPFFTDPYPDELLYSSIARYHFYSGNTNYRDTIEELFKKRSVIPSVEIGSNFSILAKQLGPSYSIESLLNKHTIYPYYSLFLSKQRQQEIIEDVQGDGKGLYGRLGMVSGGICKKNALYYCPKCVIKDIHQYGEPYIHREHQLEGIDYCAHHELKLKKYITEFETQSRFEYIRFDSKHLDLSPPKESELDKFEVIQVKLAKMAYQLLQLPINQFSRETINLKYRTLLRDRNLIALSNTVRQNQLQKEFQSKLPFTFLEKYESRIDGDDTYNWLKVIVRNLKRHVHPFRHLLMLYFLEQDVDSFIQVEIDKGPFGEGPWPCLNKVALHYRQNVIDTVTLKRDFTGTKPAGFFSCSCGSVYTRKGPDKVEYDKYHINYIKEYGHIWMEKLYQLEKEGLHLKLIAKELGVHPQTAKSYLDAKEELIERKTETNERLIKQYREELLQAMERFPNYRRTQLLEQFRKPYRYLYKHDKEWMLANLPAKKEVT
ncbi:TniQ protein [Domibacillus enclensis]|uniref:TniQ protein n=1 Tax=Domibacillus enclensis TaxID=1017273 RepID=A0A1N7AH38_9BACI|nr:TniQ protein [Domibacillus enclensis]